MPHIYSSSSQTTASGTLTMSATMTSGTSNDIVWSNWSENYYVGTLTATTATSVQPANLSTTSGTTWTAWNTIYVANTNNITRLNVDVPRAAPLTPEEQRARAEERQRWDRVRAEEAKVRAEADQRAEKILHEALTNKQRAELRDRGFFTMETIRPSGERRTYRIKRGRSGNVEQIDPTSGRVLKRLCAHPIMHVPDPDTMLAQKLMLETMEDEFLRIANVHFAAAV